MTYGFIGCGNMVGAIARALRKTTPNMMVSDRSGKANAMRRWLAAHVSIQTQFIMQRSRLALQRMMQYDFPFIRKNGLQIVPPIFSCHRCVLIRLTALLFQIVYGFPFGDGIEPCLKRGFWRIPGLFHIELYKHILGYIFRGLIISHILPDKEYQHFPVSFYDSLKAPEVSGKEILVKLISAFVCSDFHSRPPFHLLNN